MAILLGQQAGLWWGYIGPGAGGGETDLQCSAVLVTPWSHPPEEFCPTAATGKGPKKGIVPKVIHLQSKVRMLPG